MKKNNFSNTIIWYNFILCIFVILIHSQNGDRFTHSILFDGVPILNNLETFIIRYIADAGVAGFFLCSGYLFFRNYNLSLVLPKYKSRIGSLLIPYILWNLIYYFFYLIISIIPGINTLFQDKNITFSFASIIDSIINNTYCPIFWYLNFLIIFVLLSPLLFILIKNRYIGLVVLLILLYIDSTQNTIITNPTISALGNWLFIYLAGGYFGLHFRNRIETQNIPKYIILIIAICTVGISYLFTTTPSAFLNLIYYFFIAITLWCILSMCPLPYAKTWQNNSFMVYTTHFIIVRTLNVAASAFITNSMWLGITLFFLAPVICFCIVRLTQKFCYKFCPSLWNLLSGNR